MSDHALQSWLDDAFNSTQPLGFLLDPALDDTFGWGARFNQMMGPNQPCGLLLTGPDGCGKHTAAAHMFKILLDTHNALLLNGEELCADGYAVAKQRLRYAIDHPRDGYPWCLILEGMEDCSFRQQMFSWLGRTLNFEWFGETNNPEPLFLILIDSIGDDIPSILRRHLRLCRMSLPSAARRRAYFKKVDFLKDTINLDLLVDSTAGLTYAQMVDLARNLQCSLVYDGLTGFEKMRDEALMDFLDGQFPEPPMEDPLQSLAESARQFIELRTGLPADRPLQSLPTSTHQSIDLYTKLSDDNPLHSLAESARQFIEQLPNLIAQLGKTGVMLPQHPGDGGGVIVEPAPETDPEIEMAKFEKEVNNMPVVELCADLFGSEELADLNRCRPRA